MGWSDGIDMMAQSSNEMRFFFFFMQLQKESDMQCRGTDLQTSGSIKFCHIDGNGNVRLAVTSHKLRKWLCSTPKNYRKGGRSSQDSALVVGGFDSCMLTQ